ncbi:ATP-dependent (S)-NAD(P)H-hydrate dehydratase [Bacillus rossius redtenbacheri]|uniref:ATP-dependent (S)-NAD(P)H-hydrate dehydratase n=1 Tax=Bacillus rossius redtenbacheri TaxID=93214 RepID=UPI002FDD5630
MFITVRSALFTDTCITLTRHCVRVLACTMEDRPLDSVLLQAAKAIAPRLEPGKHKGQYGCIGIIGGSFEYTGAAYFAAMTTLRTGGDLAHIFCTKDAATPIKSYSPELIVHPFLDDPEAVDLIKVWLPRLHALVIGPGLGRSENVLKVVAGIIDICRNDPGPKGKPVVIDADGLFLVTNTPDVIRGYPHGAILTPNAAEFSRLAKVVLGESWEATSTPDSGRVLQLARTLGPDITVVHKGAVDVIAHGSGRVVAECAAMGSNRRCGGQGDLLSGALGLFYAWASAPTARLAHPGGVVAAYAACRLARQCNQLAFRKHGRSVLTTDMIQEIHSAFECLFEH